MQETRAHFVNTEGESRSPRFPDEEEAFEEEELPESFRLRASDLEQLLTEISEVDLRWRDDVVTAADIQFSDLERENFGWRGRARRVFGRLTGRAQYVLLP
ncbi:hypothetical protein J4H92_08595 [Leucobacter weissii]|uniref:Uncharacterized protein n=1 Tax=Leucobacter weissii TaxID=1983706 RepID=A0A939SC17_9MICO|nr:hypothetical protein [Leucobacter weissii]MBO1902005.1 hypothetical protein [Leucobacter weissii]